SSIIGGAVGVDADCGAAAQWATRVDTPGVVPYAQLSRLPCRTFSHEARPVSPFRARSSSPFLRAGQGGRLAFHLGYERTSPDASHPPSDVDDSFDHGLDPARGVRGRGRRADPLPGGGPVAVHLERVGD